jgi:hypothetical protein
VKRLDEIFPESADGYVEPFRVTPGFIAFIGLACLPAIVALAVFFGAWMVADDVKRAEAASAQQPGSEQQVEGWKKTLVGICPVH